MNTMKNVMTKPQPGIAQLKGGTAGELPKYKCHKEVWALKIKGTILRLSGEMSIEPENDEYMPFRVSKEYVDKHNPIPGGYYVRYDDGYESFSPMAVFEDGYTLID